MSQYSHLSTPDPELALALHNLVSTLPAQTGDVNERRELLKKFHATQRRYLEPRLPKGSELRVEEHKLAVEDGEITVRCMVPTTGNAEQTFPVLVWFHGGGFTIGDLDMDDYRLRIMCVEHQLAIVNVDYRLAPEYVYPVPWDDAYAAIKWVVENTSLLSASLAKGFIVSGASAGANLAASVSCRARDDPFFAKMPLTGQVLHIPPVVDHADPEVEKYQSELLSMEQNKDGPFLTRDIILDVSRKIQVPISSPTFSVLLQPSHAGLPPAFMQVAGMDPLRDEGLLYAKVLEQAGVKTKVEVYPGVPHGFMRSFPRIKVSVKADKDLDDGIKWLLSLSA